MHVALLWLSAKPRNLWSSTLSAMISHPPMMELKRCTMRLRLLQRRSQLNHLKELTHGGLPKILFAKWGNLIKGTRVIICTIASCWDLYHYIYLTLPPVEPNTLSLVHLVLER